MRLYSRSLKIKLQTLLLVGTTVTPYKYRRRRPLCSDNPV
jgi:hypothetical protein